MILSPLPSSPLKLLPYIDSPPAPSRSLGQPPAQSRSLGPPPLANKRSLRPPPPARSSSLPHCVPPSVLSPVDVDMEVFPSIQLDVEVFPPIQLPGSNPPTVLYPVDVDTAVAALGHSVGRIKEQQKQLFNIFRSREVVAASEGVGGRSRSRNRSRSLQGAGPAWEHKQPSTRHSFTFDRSQVEKYMKEQEKNVMEVKEVVENMEVLVDKEVVENKEVVEDKMPLLREIPIERSDLNTGEDKSPYGRSRLGSGRELETSLPEVTFVEIPIVRTVKKADVINIKGDENNNNNTTTKDNTRAGIAKPKDKILNCHDKHPCHPTSMSEQDSMSGIYSDIDRDSYLVS